MVLSLSFCLILPKLIIMKTIVNVLLFLVSFFGFSQEKFEVFAVEKFQKELNIEYLDAKKSPLTAEDFKEFKTLDFYPINEKFFVIAHFVRTEREQAFEMKTSTNRRPIYIKYGVVHFSLEGKSFQLNVYRNIELSKTEEYNDYLFLPFSDLTSGNQSYIGGKYIDLRIPKNNTIAIDFNTAYNPYCAYNQKYSCPIVPLENDLNIKILAGVKKFHD
jgi:uncharacterized protein (DUF1684 family)